MIILPYTCVKSVHKIATPDVGGQKSWTSAGTGCCPLFFSSLPKLLALLTFESMVVSLSFFFLAARAALYLHMNDCLTDRLVVLPGPPTKENFINRFQEILECCHMWQVTFTLCILSCHQSSFFWIAWKNCLAYNVDIPSMWNTVVIEKGDQNS